VADSQRTGDGRRRGGGGGVVAGRAFSKFRGDYYEHSGRASDVARTLALSAIAVVWVFKKETEASYALDPPLVASAFLAVAALASDILQYTWQAAVWGVWTRRKELEGAAEDTPLVAPPWFNWPAMMLFAAKLGLVLCCYVVLLRYLASRLHVW
jgi:hypothetical protein